VQTETPEQLKAFNDSAQKGCKRKVVQRKAVTVLTQGTLTDPCMVSDSPHATYVATVVEEPMEGDSDKTMVGVCMADTAASTLLLGQFEDGKMRSQTLKYFTGARFHSFPPSFFSFARVVGSLP
jgi:DNA mismatch repair ATPase MutS